ncbi:branched-chain-amino-acid aminotransferase, mitochondrial isoform X3 [Larus michahellis]|uniref:branched-chain-amino-acid aminotransferase, mitochondrial isoform X3 n=1 Tax=Larus michahellis TaxID=119627 RepID=UPI003D9B5BBC
MAAAALRSRCRCRGSLLVTLLGPRRGYNHVFRAADLSLERSGAPRAKPGPGDLVFGREFTDHMLSVEWSRDGGWGPPRIHPFRDLRLHPATSALHYGVQLFEGMKAFRGEDDKIRLFRPELNMERMQRSAARACPARLRRGGAAGVHPGAGAAGAGVGPPRPRHQPLHPPHLHRHRALAGGGPPRAGAALCHPLPGGSLFPGGALQPRGAPGRPLPRPGLARGGRELQAGGELRPHHRPAAGGPGAGVSAGPLAPRPPAAAHRGRDHEPLHLLAQPGRGAGAGDPPPGRADPARGDPAESAGAGAGVGRVRGAGGAPPHGVGAGGPGPGAAAGDVRVGDGLRGVSRGGAALQGAVAPGPHHGARPRAGAALPARPQRHPVRPRPQQMGPAPVTPPERG